jgi:hypothetical protein
MKNWIFAIAMTLAQVLSVGQAAAHDMNEHQITMVMKQLFEKPDAPLTVVPISVEGDYAVAGWIQGGRGGRAFLQKEKNQWAIAVCGGSGLTQADVMQAIGMKSDAATRLAAAVVAAEGKLSADKRKLFDGFEGMVKVDQAAGQDAHSMHGQHTGHSEPMPK